METLTRKEVIVDQTPFDLFQSLYESYGSRTKLVGFRKAYIAHKDKINWVVLYQTWFYIMTSFQRNFHVYFHFLLQRSISASYNTDTMFF